MRICREIKKINEQKMMQSSLNDLKNKIIAINQKNELSKKSQFFQNSSSDYDRDRDRNRNYYKSQCYRKKNHQNPATNPNSNVIRGNRINKSAKNNSRIKCFRCHKKNHYASTCFQS